MSVLIKGMNLPEDGCHHMVCIYSDGIVVTYGGHRIAEELPPHGRLGDLDMLQKKIDIARNYGMIGKTAHAKLQKLIKEVPTIIPASEEGET